MLNKYMTVSSITRPVNTGLEVQYRKKNHGISQTATASAIGISSYSLLAFEPEIK